jgi:hypothetical protein
MSLEWLKCCSSVSICQKCGNWSCISSYMIIKPYGILSRPFTSTVALKILNQFRAHFYGLILFTLLFEPCNVSDLVDWGRSYVRWFFVSLSILGLFAQEQDDLLSWGSSRHNSQVDQSRSIPSKREACGLLCCHRERRRLLTQVSTWRWSRIAETIRETCTDNYLRSLIVSGSWCRNLWVLSVGIWTTLLPEKTS